MGRIREEGVPAWEEQPGKGVQSGMCRQNRRGHRAMASKHIQPEHEVLVQDQGDKGWLRTLLWTDLSARPGNISESRKDLSNTDVYNYISGTKLWKKIWRPTYLGREPRTEKKEQSPPFLADKDVHIPTPRTCDYATLPGKVDFTDMIQVKDPEMGDYPGLSGWAPTHYMSPHRGWTLQGSGQGTGQMTLLAVNMEEQGHETRTVGNLKWQGNRFSPWAWRRKALVYSASSNLHYQIYDSRKWD